MSVLDEIQADAQPGYAPSVAVILQRFRQALGEVAFAGVAKPDFGLHAVRMIEASTHPSGVKLQLVSDLSSLNWWCDLQPGDAFSAALAALARRTYFQEAQAIPHQLEVADPAALRSHSLFVGRLLDLRHSPTRGAFDYLRALTSDPQNQRVDVFHAGVMSPDLQAYARARLGASISKVTFVSIESDLNFLAKAAGQGPRTFHFWCEEPFFIHISLVALVGPTLMFTCGDAAPVQFADVYWYCQEPGYIEGLWRRKGAPAAFADAYHKIESAPFPCPAPLHARTRGDLGFRAEETVIVTVGNRLGVDMDQAFVDGMGALVLSDPNVRWVVVGWMQEFWTSAFESVLGSQFTHIPYDDDLASLLQVCDVFANPFRAGGGTTAIMAIDAGAVVMTRGDMGDVGAFVPPRHLTFDAEAYFGALQSLVDDKALRAAWLAEQQTLLARRVDQDNFARELKELVGLAFTRFAQRVPTPLETIFAQPQARRLALSAAGQRARSR
ncbi:hypothetical protein [Phenylobacterium sp.]|uniref:hypothetical protein n=1 Tax=Phenylobacterium sp. TaxID=1871053 RepID=UPI002733DDBE|nr:hypothetical protein [Phenylobacterium sp.]MDP3855266.1 hypothetical protein [Phenylobacterium sp.]